MHFSCRNCSSVNRGSALQAPGQKEQTVLELVLKTTPAGNPQAVLDAIDNYAWTTGFLMNMGTARVPSWILLFTDLSPRWVLS